jgi:hypothetical protein
MFIILQVATTQFALPHFVFEQAGIVADPLAAFLLPCHSSIPPSIFDLAYSMPSLMGLFMQIGFYAFPFVAFNNVKCIPVLS